MKTIIKSKVINFFLILFVVLVSVTACDKDDDEPQPSLNAPTLNNASEVQSTSFKATWSTVQGAEKYLLDVSLNSNFNTTVTGYNKKEISELSTSVTGLTANTKYYFRVFAKKGTVTSAASSVKDVTTNQ